MDTTHGELEASPGGTGHGLLLVATLGLAGTTHGTLGTLLRGEMQWGATRVQSRRVRENHGAIEDFAEVSAINSIKSAYSGTCRLLIARESWGMLISRKTKVRLAGATGSISGVLRTLSTSFR